MTDKEKMQVDNDLTPSRMFIFSTPSVVSSPAKSIKTEPNLDYISESYGRKNIFTFAEPTAVEQTFGELDGYAQDSDNSSDKHYKPKISRNAFKGVMPCNDFTQTLKDGIAFEQLKKNSRSQALKVIECSITCFNVPQLLLTKTVAKEYFQTFGQILKITIRPKKRIIRVFYSTKKEANTAYSKSGEYLGEKFDVRWTKSDAVPKSPSKKKEFSKNVVGNLLKADDEDVKMELDALINSGYNAYNESPGIGTETGMFSAIKTRTVYAKNPAKHEKFGLRSDKTISKTEKSEPESHISTPLPAATMEELQHIVRQVALSSEDKYKVLEARDKLMRMKQVKSHSLAMAKLTRGTCPDMCPEKERLMRESQRQVAPYEQMNCTEYKINHATAVKQYSRSSADQEEPMAHDLRPVISLKMTMSYLLHEVADLCERQGTNLAEWYHFLWDRTRSIRKDITIQELCCTDSVELVEQCARFHIVCSERLCAEESSVFDKKINSENLTKCLQSLKYMYHDLRVKGVACKNEPEFRAYVILLNLNTANFMSDLQQLPLSIQKSPEVKFSVKVFTSLESNNYCTFFKLVRKTTYLNACILLRYFSQVRMKALSVMVKAYCRTMSTAYPLYELIHNLGFEDENEAIHFCEQVGLLVSSDELHVLLNKQNFSLPVNTIQQGRACNIVGRKRLKLRVTIGQCIAGGVMPEQMYKNHKPHNSFDAHGFLTSHSLNAEDQNLSTPYQKEDPYEFIDDDSIDSVQTPTQQENNQQNVFFGQLKSTSAGSDFESPCNQDSSIIDQPNLFKPINKSTISINIFQPVKSNKDLCSKVVPVATATQDTSNASSFGTHAVASGAFVSKSSPFKFSHSEVNTLMSTPRVSSIFGNTGRSSVIFSKPPVNYTMQTTLSHDIKASSPFTISTNTNICMESIPKNIFAKPSTSSSTFSAIHSSVENASPHFNSATNTTGNKFQHLQSSTILSPAQTDTSQSVNTERMDAEKVQQVDIAGLKKLQKIDEDTSKIFAELETDVVDEFCSNIIKEEIIQIALHSISEKIFHEICNKMCHEICNTILAEEIAKQQKLQEITKKFKNRIALKCFNAWKQYTIKRKRQREALNDTPVWIQRQSIEMCARELYHDQQNIVIEHMNKKPSIMPVERPITDLLAPIEIIIHAGIKEHLKSLDAITGPISFWKLIISWPNLENKTSLWHHKNIVNKYLSPINHTTEPIIKSFQPNEYESLHICIRHFEGLISDDKLIGTDALLFVTAATEDFKCVSRRLTKTVLCKDKLMPIPLVFLILGEGDLENKTEDIIADLEILSESGYVSEYTITVEKSLNENVLLNLTQSSALWLAVNKSPPNPLEMDDIRNIYDLCLTEELWLRITGASMFNTKLSRALNEPNFVIDLHNEAIMHLMDIILDPETLMYTKFPPELKRFLKTESQLPFGYEYFDDMWQKNEYRVVLENIMNNFILPPWSTEWPICDTQLLHQSVMDYCQQILSDSNSNIVTCDILSKIFLSTGSLRVTNFVDILLSIVKEKINLLSENMRVVYNKNHIKHFRTLPWWFKSNVLTEFVIQEESVVRSSVDDEEVNARKKQRMSGSHNSIECDDPLGEFCRQTQDSVMNVHYSAKALENILKTQQLKNKLLEEKLMRALNDDCNKV